VSRNRIADIDVGFRSRCSNRHALVDASDAPRKIFPCAIAHSCQARNAHPLLSEWLPGEHGPTGPITDLTGLKFTANGKTLKWRRDLLDGYTFHVEVPEGENEVTADLDYASAVSPEPGYSSSMSATEKLYVVSWNTLLLYPTGYGSDQLTYTAACACPRMEVRHVVACASQAGNDIHFEPFR